MSFPEKIDGVSLIIFKDSKIEDIMNMISFDIIKISLIIVAGVALAFALIYHFLSLEDSEE